MKLAHLSDLHLGKVVCGYSMLEDQREILHQIEEKLEIMTAESAFPLREICWTK